tara:strand:- start:31 stop:207 length:177 start_codon:yes stop_codon:yes gene_type:complete
MSPWHQGECLFVSNKRHAPLSKIHRPLKFPFKGLTIASRHLRAPRASSFTRPCPIQFL